MEENKEKTLKPGKNYHIYSMPDELFDKIVEKKIKDKRSINQTIIVILEQFFENETKKTK